MRRIPLAKALLVLLGAAAAAAAARTAVPAWLFPFNPAATAALVPPDSVTPIRLPGSDATFTAAQLKDLYSAPDWHPESHTAMPPVVAHGRAPEVYACGYCHSPSGQGRPENAALAGLPAAYIVQQVADFKSGARRSAWPAPYPPADFMISIAAHANAAEVAAAADYFSKQKLQVRVAVIERAQVPRAHVVGWIYVADPGGASEPIGMRLLEFAPNAARHEQRDDRLRYVAYVPPGSIAHGKLIAQSGAAGLTAPCIACHGDQLHGVGLVPPLAGRSPTYLLRQLLGFQSGARAGATAISMQVIVARLTIGDMVDLAAYLASLPP
jgi:cytochrome c553